MLYCNLYALMFCLFYIVPEVIIIVRNGVTPAEGWGSFDPGPVQLRGITESLIHETGILSTSLPLILFFLATIVVGFVHDQIMKNR